MAGEPRWLTWANGLSLLRLAAAPALAAVVCAQRPRVAAALFALAVASDFADGAVARRRGEATPLGGLLDHACDASFVATGLAALAWLGAIPWALPPLVALAFVQYALDSRSLRGLPLRASRLGRWNGLAYYVLLATPLVRDALRLSWPPRAVVRGMGLALVASTLVSMGDRWIAWRRAATRAAQAD
jgi:CDP-diacylglycerol---glycerol-3-phosphate 3-phosphatidyltransferase